MDYPYRTIPVSTTRSCFQNGSKDAQIGVTITPSTIAVPTADFYIRLKGEDSQDVHIQSFSLSAGSLREIVEHLGLVLEDIDAAHLAYREACLGREAYLDAYFRGLVRFRNR